MAENLVLSGAPALLSSRPGTEQHPQEHTERWPIISGSWNGCRRPLAGGEVGLGKGCRSSMLLTLLGMGWCLLHWICLNWPSYPPPWWVQWTQITGKLLAVCARAGPTLFLVAQQILASSASAPGSPNVTEPAGRHSGLHGPTQEDSALSRGSPWDVSSPLMCQARYWGGPGSENSCLGGETD